MALSDGDGGSWVVMEARAGGSRSVWCWGLVRSGPGFDDVFFTEADGVTPADIDSPPQLLATLFVVPVATAPAGGRVVWGPAQEAWPEEATS
jgi:hypothetical protein